MKQLHRLAAPSALILAAGLLCLSGCVTHEREVVHDGGGSYAQGYKEGYYDREHHRYWSEQAWHDCIEHDVHCPQ
jgi:hypothetical protein